MRLKPQAYAITINTHAHARHRLFQRTANAELLIATLLRYRDQARFLLHAFVVMPDHLHVLLTPTESTSKAVQVITIHPQKPPRLPPQPQQAGPNPSLLETLDATLIPCRSPSKSLTI